MARRLYLGKLPADARTDDVSKFFDGFGRIVDCRVMTGSYLSRTKSETAVQPTTASGFGFVEFENPRDAEDAVSNFNGKNFMGSSIVVEFAKETRRRGGGGGGGDVYEGGGDRYGGSPRSRRPPGIRLIVSGISRDTSWQDLKDFGREAGSVSYADIDRDHPGQGVLEYLARDDADRAVKDLDGKDLRGRPVRVTFDESRGGPDNYRREDRRDDRRDDRYPRGGRDDRPPYRRERSRSPPRREFDDRRPARSPPPRRDYEERRPAGYDDRRGGYYDDPRGPDPYYDRRREEEPRRRDDRRRDEKDDRFDDRPPRPANGDGGWSR
ncbi:hypothetical protein JAAARDRAFT_55821 [Jaapia argillacea MUCL 33604]|uniref:RRM domain-containing protein n=1 Tax=Jaapia argillacea MUCL 33604 TaxID=933084 RepID=A0A067QC81_9AGAM|nr:hypothetical protein JAAARDRAFT_55821 [Jaapia argillacea MUCL 33604]